MFFISKEYCNFASWLLKTHSHINMMTVRRRTDNGSPKSKFFVSTVV